MRDDFDDHPADAKEADERAEDDLWFLSGPIEDKSDDLPPGPRAERRDTAILDDRRNAEAGHAARLARVAGRLGALDERLKRGAEGWRHRLALIRATDLGWFTGDRIAPDRLALWISMRLPGVQDDATALARVAWAVRRLTGGPGPEAAVTASRIAASDGKGAIFAPLAMGGAGGLRAGGGPAERLARWLDGMEAACLSAMRDLDDVEAWAARAEAEMAGLSGRTPPALRKVLTEWPFVSSPMAEALTGASRAAIRRNLAWMEDRGLVRELTGQGRHRMRRIR